MYNPCGTSQEHKINEKTHSPFEDWVLFWWNKVNVTIPKFDLFLYSMITFIYRFYLTYSCTCLELFSRKQLTKVHDLTTYGHYSLNGNGCNLQMEIVVYNDSTSKIHKQFILFQKNLFFVGHLLCTQSSISLTFFECTFYSELYWKAYSAWNTYNYLIKH
jgi:hypothetical protein